MEPDRYRIVKEAFAEVSRAPAAEQERVLSRVCGDDDELRREVESLLAFDESTSEGLLADKPTRSGEPTASSSFEGDFAPGQVLIGRYRIVALIGEGGMGQVYLADDLVLGQPVALKFLPKPLAGRAGGLERFRAEVRHAREVTHPNVARVHDIGEVDGRHFLTMEFVDGEDLASLIHRIGRLPQEKAAEIAQQICAGLAEAHRKGVLHRDLKPANVMLDGEGRVRLTDFGLAVAAESEDASGLVGTPQYMAPEQLSGVEASVQSEVYSLGLLLYELYTGRRALHGRTLEQLRLEHEKGGPDPPSSHLEQLAPEVDALLTRCLARDPALRPASVSEVARALPGGDPLVAALAAGETPAPHQVAAARTEGALTPRSSTALVLGIVALSLLFVLGRSWLQERDGVSYGKPMGYLRERARELAQELSGEEDLPYEVHWYQADPQVAAALAQHDEALGTTYLLHHSRFGPEDFVPKSLFVNQTDPAPKPGSMHLVLDADGRLVSWAYRSTDAEPAAGTGAPWDRMLELAGLPARALESAEPEVVPDAFADERSAWRLAIAESENATDPALRIEGAALNGRVVEFALMNGPTRLGTFAWEPTRGAGGDLFFFALIVLSALLAWRNVRASRADVRGAILIGTYTTVAHVVHMFGRTLPESLGGITRQLSWNLSYAMQTGVQVALLYLALEPFARRRWPRMLIGWNRLLEGRWRDPSVGREVLFGLLGASVFVAVKLPLVLVVAALGFDEERVALPTLQPTLGIVGPLPTICHLVHHSGDTMIIGGMLTFALLAARSVLGSRWLATAAWLVAMTFFVSAFQGYASAVLLLIVVLILLVRVGFLAVAAWWFGYQALWTHLLTLRPGDWYFPSSLVVLVVLVVLGLLIAWAWRASLAESPVLGTPVRGSR